MESQSPAPTFGSFGNIVEIFFRDDHCKFHVGRKFFKQLNRFNRPRKISCAAIKIMLLRVGTVHADFERIERRNQRLNVIRINERRICHELSRKAKRFGITGNGQSQRRHERLSARKNYLGARIVSFNRIENFFVIVEGQPRRIFLAFCREAVNAIQVATVGHVQIDGAQLRIFVSKRRRNLEKFLPLYRVQEVADTLGGNFRAP